MCQAEATSGVRACWNGRKSKPKTHVYVVRETAVDRWRRNGLELSESRLRGSRWSAEKRRLKIKDGSLRSSSDCQTPRGCLCQQDGSSVPLVPQKRTSGQFIGSANRILRSKAQDTRKGISLVKINSDITTSSGSSTSRSHQILPGA